MIGRKQVVYFRQQGLQKANTIMTKEAMPLINHETSHLRRRCPRAVWWLAYWHHLVCVYKYIYISDMHMFNNLFTFPSPPLIPKLRGAWGTYKMGIQTTFCLSQPSLDS